MKCFHLCFPSSLVWLFQTSRSVEQKARGNKSTRVPVTSASHSHFPATHSHSPL
jgi:hypothetical protein